MRNFWTFGIAVLLFLSGCKKEKDEQSLDEIVCKQAESYYQSLVGGSYADFLEGLSGTSSMLPEQREQALDALKMFCQIQQKNHGGIVKSRGVNANIQGDRAEVFVGLIYADSIREKIVVPMILVEGIWKME